MKKNEIVEYVKQAKRITTDACNTEIERLIDAAYYDIKASINVNFNETDLSIVECVKTYVIANFGENPNREKLMLAYDNQLSKIGVRYVK